MSSSRLDGQKRHEHGLDRIASGTAVAARNERCRRCDPSRRLSGGLVRAGARRSFFAGGEQRCQAQHDENKVH